MSASGRKLARWILPVYLGSIYATLGVARSLTEYVRAAGLLRTAVLVIFLAVGALIAVVLGRDPRSRSWRVLAAALLCAGAYAAVTLPMQSPEEKLHFIEYGGVALLAYAACPERWSGPARFAGSAVFVAAAGWCDEGIQALLPTRFYDLRDVGFNAAAGVMALAAFAFIRFARGRSAATAPIPPAR